MAGGTNLYAYAGNNPVSFSDPFGLTAESSCPPCIAIAIGVGIALYKQYYNAVRDGVSLDANINENMANAVSEAGILGVAAQYAEAGLVAQEVASGTQVASGAKGVLRASELEAAAVEQGWTRSKTPSGPVKYTDKNGVVRLTLKRGSPRAPGSGAPHAEFRNATGERVDVNGNPTTRRSPANHTPIEYDIDP